MPDDQERSQSTRGSSPMTSATLEAGHRMFQRYLESAYPEALVLAEDVLRIRPDDPMAQAVLRECQAMLGPTRDREPTAPDVAAQEGPGADADLDASLGYDRDRTPPASSIAPPLSGERTTEMYDLFLAGDFLGALALAESILERNADDDLARAVRSQCCDALGIEARVPALRSNRPRP
jgi:hypothetical protein